MAGVLHEAFRVGLAYVLRTAPSRGFALEAASVALEERLVGPDTTSDRMSAADLLAAVEQLSQTEQAMVLGRVRLGNGDTLVSQLRSGNCESVVRALRRLASGAGRGA